MPTPFENLDNVFDVHAEVVDGLEREEEKTPKEIVKVDKPAPDITTEKDKDLDYVRAGLYQTVEDMKELMQEAMENAIQSGHPRAFEVAFNGGRTMTDIMDKLVDIHKKKSDMETEKTIRNQTNIQNNITMTTSDMIKLIKDAENDWNRCCCDCCWYGWGRTQPMQGANSGRQERLPGVRHSLWSCKRTSR